MPGRMLPVSVHEMPDSVIKKTAAFSLSLKNIINAKGYHSITSN